MSVQMNIAEAKAKLSELVALAERGEEVVIARSGRPVLRFTLIKDAPSEKPHMRSLGALAHLGSLSDEDNDLIFGPDPDWAGTDEDPARR